jgi:DNA-binding GntR family transcriptional regulator
MTARSGQQAGETGVATRSGEPAYKILARELRSAILQGRYADGARLPTEVELADKYRFSRQTVRRAFQELVAEGMVHRTRGRGTFPARQKGQQLRHFGSIEALMALDVDTTLEVLRPLGRHVNVEAAGRLRLDSDAVQSLVLQQLSDGEPFCYSTVFLHPVAAAVLAGFPDLAEPGARLRVSPIALLDGRLPSPIAEAEQSITASVADDTVADSLGCPRRAPLLRVDRTFFDADDLPVVLGISYFVPDHYSYRVRIRRTSR